MSAVITWTDDGGVTVALSLDVGETESYENTAAVTVHPLETGANIADGVRPNPATFSLAGMVTNSPIVVPATQMGGVTGAMQPTEITVGGRTLKVNALVFSGAFDRVAAVDALLLALVEAGTLVGILTSLRQIDHAVVTSYHVDRTAATGNAIPVTLQFQVLRVVNTQTVSVPAPRQRRGHAPGAHGAQPATPADASTQAAAQNTSILGGLFQ